MYSLIAELVLAKITYFPFNVLTLVLLTLSTLTNNLMNLLFCFDIQDIDIIFLTFVYL